MSVYGFNEKDVGRISQTVRRVEQLPAPGPANQQTTRPGSIVHPVEVSSTTPDSDGYLPATAYPEFDSSTGELGDGVDALVLDLNA